MRKRLITGRALVRHSDGCRVLKDGLTANSFSGVIGSDFHERITGHWGLSGTAMFGPARKFFLKPFCLPDFFPVRSGGLAGAYNYTLLSQIQMKLALGVSNRMFFEGPTYLGSQTSTLKTGEQQRVGLAAATSTLREFWLSLSHSLLRAPVRDRERSGQRGWSFIAVPRWQTGIDLQQRTYQTRTESREVIGPSFTRLVHATRRWLQFLRVATSSGANGWGLQRSQNNDSLRIGGTSVTAHFEVKEQVMAWPGLVLRKIVNLAFKAGDDLSQHWSLPSLLIPRARIQLSLSGGASGLSPLTFVVPQRGSREVETDIRRHFAESSTMHFARHESQLVQKLVSALKESRETQTVIRREAPPQIEIEQLSRQVYQQLEREIKIEKERRGR